MSEWIAPGHSASSCAVVVVDDDPAVRDSVRLLFASDDLAVATYEDASSLLTSRKFPTCGCLLIDVLLPDLNGIALLRQLRAQGSPLPAVIMSDEVTPQLRSVASAAGALIVLGKPLSKEFLVDLTREALRQCGHYAADTTAR